MNKNYIILLGVLAIVFVVSYLLLMPYIIKHGPEESEKPLPEPSPEVPPETKLDYVDLMLPVKISEINHSGYIGIGPFGIHRGNHIEGLDHVWFSVNKGTVIRAPANGTVLMVTEREPGDFYIVIKHNDSIYSYLDHLKNVTVSVNDEVIQGQPIGFPREDMGPNRNEAGFDFGLADKRVTDGPKTWIIEEGSFVSPYEYLNPSNKSAVENEYYIHKQLPYLENGTIVGDFIPAEPYLTNEIFLHRGHQGEIYGVWFIKDQPWAFGGMPEIIALKICENNPFYNGTYFAFWDGESNYGYNTYGNFTVDLTKEPHWVTFTATDGTIYYGIFYVNETDERPTLLLEYSTTERPTQFTENAVLYTLRSRDNPRWEKPSEGISKMQIQDSNSCLNSEYGNIERANMINVLLGARPTTEMSRKIER